MNTCFCRNALLAVLVLISVHISTLSHAQEAGHRFVVVNPVKSALELIEKGQLQQAKAVLDAIDQLPEDKHALLEQNEIAYAHARLLQELGDHQQAVTILRQLLLKSPSRTRLRLELARSLYALKMDRQAKHHFELVLAGDLPDTVKKNIHLFLENIRMRRTWRTRFALALAPDSNRNSASGAETVDIFGLPFSLDDAARSSSGLGLFLSTGLDWNKTISPSLSIKAQANGQRTEHRGKDFDDTLAAFTMSATHTKNKWQHSLEALSYRRWFGSHAFNRGIGTRLSTHYASSDNWSYGASATLQHIRYDYDASRTGYLKGFDLFANHILDSQTRLSYEFGGQFHKARSKFQSFNSWRIGLNGYREIKGGLSISAGPFLHLQSYHASHPFYAKTRSDAMLGLSFELAFKKLAFAGLEPIIGYSFAQNRSNIDIYDFSRHRGTVGLKALF